MSLALGSLYDPEAEPCENCSGRHGQPKCLRCGTTPDGTSCFLCSDCDRAVDAERTRRSVAKKAEDVAGYLEELRAPGADNAMPLPSLNGTQTLESWQRIDAPRVVPALKRWASGEVDRWILLQGVSDTGKSHLAAAALVQAIKDQGKRGRFITTIDWLLYLRQNRDEQSRLLRQVMTAPLLVIDDLGTENASEWTLNTWYSVFNYRAFTNRSLPTLITTNYPLKELGDRWAAAATPRDAQRVVRRISDSSILIEMPAIPYRRYRKD